MGFWGVEEVWGRDRRAHARAWFAPLPPEPVAKEWERSVSPGEGRRGVRVIRSVFREPIIVIWGVGMMGVGFGGWGWNGGVRGVRGGLEDWEFGILSHTPNDH